MVLKKIIFIPLLLSPNSVRNPLVGGTRQRPFDGINFKPRKLLENPHAAMLSGDRVHTYPSACSGRCVSRLEYVEES